MRNSFSKEKIIDQSWTEAAGEAKEKLKKNAYFRCSIFQLNSILQIYSNIF
jgi:hypothetical protein